MELDRIDIVDNRFVDKVTGLALVRWYSVKIGWRGTVLVADADEVIVLVGGKKHSIPTGNFLRHWTYVLEVPSGD